MAEHPIDALPLFALDQLSPAEHAAVDAHVDGCLRCRTELVELRSVLATLTAGIAGDVAADVTPPGELGDHVVARVRRARGTATPLPRRRNRRLVELGAAAAAVAVFAAGSTYAVTRPAPGPPQEIVAIASESAGVSATGTLIAHTWGTELKIVMLGLDDGREYVVTFTDATGAEVSAGTLIGDSTRPVVCSLNAALLRADAAGFEITTATGELVLRADTTQRGAIATG